MKFEYFTKSLYEMASDSFVTELNELGEQGWELIAITGEIYIFKRVIVDEIIVSKEAIDRALKFGNL